MLGLEITLIPEGVGSVLWFLVLGSLSAMLFSLAKTGFGGSVGLLAVPVMIYACGGNADLAMGIMLPMLIAADCVAVITWRGQWRLNTVLRMLPGVVAGIAAGGGMLYLLGRAGQRRELIDAAMKLGIGALALLFVALKVINTVRKRPLTFRPGPLQATGVGAGAGFASTLSHAAGPIVAMYMLSQGMPKARYVATTALFFWIGNLLKLVPYGTLGLINTGTLGAGVVLIPAIAVGALLGLFLHKRVGPKQFNAVVYALLLLAGADLIRKAIDSLVH